MRTGLLIAASLLVSACGEWDAFVYDDADDLTSYETLTGFDNFEQCQEAAIDRLRRRGLTDTGTYECGRSCRWDEGYEVNVCKETRD